MVKTMLSQKNLKLVAVALLIFASAVFFKACGRRSQANGKQEAPATTAPAAVAVTTAAAIKRELPRFFEATGSLAGDQQTDAAPQTSGKSRRSWRRDRQPLTRSRRSSKRSRASSRPMASRSSTDGDEFERMANGLSRAGRGRLGIDCQLPEGR